MRNYSVAEEVFRIFSLALGKESTLTNNNKHIKLYFVDQVGKQRSQKRTKKQSKSRVVSAKVSQKHSCQDSKRYVKYNV